MRKDFFVSYNSADRHWAEWIAWQLEEAGYTTTIQSWDIRPGTNFVLEMARAAEEAERTIAVITISYLQSTFTQPEWAAAFIADPLGERNLLLPVRVEECDISGLLRTIVYIDLVGLNEVDAKHVLLSGIQRTRAKPAVSPRFPGKELVSSSTHEQRVSSPFSREIESGEYDIFICYNSNDRDSVKAISRDLKDRGIIPWLDEWEIQPGTDWQGALEKQINNIRSAGVFVGPHGLGPWQDLEKKALLQQFTNRGRPVIPVILQDCENDITLPPFLNMLHYVDFRESDPDPMEQLIWGITGKRPSSLK